jgi:diketogulonate reductase-like aldo/keto reductase
VAETALGVGYRLLDNAAEYGNEDQVGKAIHKVMSRLREGARYCCTVRVCVVTSQQELSAPDN